MSDETVPAHQQELTTEVEVLRESVTMALYVSLSLIAVLVVLPQSVMDDVGSIALTICVTAIGLVFAHQIAFSISTRLVLHGGLGILGSRLLWAQLAGGAVAVVLAVVPAIIFGANAVTASVLTLLAFVCIIGYQAARSVPVSRFRALIYVGVVVVLVAGLLLIKSLVAH